MHKDIEPFLKQLSDLFRERRLTLSVAESCTGGLIADMITDVPGASDSFDSAMVTYSAPSKMQLIGVHKVTIVKNGVVSEETARQMAEGIRRIRKTDFSLSSTGNLGPTALEGKDIGSVFFAVASREGTISKGMQFSGDRRSIKEQAAREALMFLYEQVKKSGPPAQEIR
ncbi:MAG: CinA family protein [bacterium]